MPQPLILNALSILKEATRKPIQLLILLFVFAFPQLSLAEDAKKYSLAELGQEADKAIPAEKPKAIENGLSLASPMQAVQAFVTSEGVQIRSTSDGKKQIGVTPIAVGKGVSSKPSLGKVLQDGNTIVLQRDLLTERISSNSDGIRQDFLIHKKPAGTGVLTVDLALHGAKASQKGADVLLKMPDGRELVYSKLHITDANGTVLQGSLLASNSDQLQIQVDDTNAQYPILIDPTYSDADWGVMNPTIPGVNGQTYVAVVHNGDLYVGGRFSLAGGVPASNVARWDGTSWSSLGDGMNNTVNALAVYNGELYAGGEFTTAGSSTANRIAKWNGSTWSPIGAGMDNPVLVLEVIGSELYAGGSFASADGVPANRIAKYNGSAWSAMGSEFSYSVMSIKEFNGEIYAAGYWHGVNKWNGVSWTPVGISPGGNAPYFALEVYNGELYAGGGGGLSGGIVKWDGSNWSSVGSGLNSDVKTLKVYAGELYAGGNYTIAGGNTTNFIAKWNGTAWSDVGGGVSSSSSTVVEDFALYNGNLVVLGAIGNAGSKGVSNVAFWDGTQWTDYSGSGFNGTIQSVVTHNGNLYAGGAFTVAPGGMQEAKLIAKWDGASWEALPGLVSSPSQLQSVTIFALTIFNGQIIAAGNFNTANGGAADLIARWDGTNWLPLGSGLTGTYVRTLHVHNNELYVGGSFTSAGGTAVANIAKWDGNSWSALSSGLSSFATSILTYNGDLIVGGAFTTAGGVSASRIARWDGNSWFALSSGLNQIANKLVVYNDDIVAVGGFTMAGGVTAPRVAKWNGSNWSALGAGVGGQATSAIVHNDELIVSGGFATAGGVPANFIAKWDGSSWSALGSGLTGSGVQSLVVYNEKLYVGGSFTAAGGKVTPYFASLATPVNVSFDGNGATAGSVPAKQYKNPGDPSITVANNSGNLTRIGYSFVGWNTNADGTGTDYAPGSEYSGDVNITLYAKWAVNSYTLTFDSAGGSSVTAITANFGASVTPPANPSRIGYTFAGWSPAVPATMPSEDTTLTAQWTANNYTLTFDAAGGSPVTPITAAFGTSVTEPTAPTRAGYTFTGWSPAVPATVPSEDTSYTAQWAINSYTITFDSAGGSAVNAITADFGTVVTPPTTPTREGYTFAAWSPAVPSTMPSADTTLTAQWTVNSYTITFDSAGGSAVNAITADFGSVVAAPTAPTREGYTFAGWSPALPATMPSSDTTVTAQWTINNYTLSFDSAGGSGVSPITAAFGSSVTAPAAPTREGYTFAGWSPAIPATMPAADATLIAQWTVNNYTLTFDSAGGSGVSPITAAFGSSVTAPTAPTREGYTFVGWSPAVPSTMPAADTTFTAQWTVNNYTLTFDSAGGSGVSPITAAFGSSVTAPVDPTREGYTFAGWSPAVPATMPSSNTNLTAQWAVNSYTLSFDSAGGSDVNDITADFGSVVTAPTAPTREGYTFAGWSPAVPSTMPAADTTLTAQWTVNNYTLSFDTSGGSTVSPIVAAFGSNVTAPVAPTREGYSFAGWSPAVPSTMPAADTTLTAQWTINSYTLTFDSAGGSAVSPIVAAFGSNVTAPVAPTREGYTFAGWSPAVPATMPSSNSTLTAQWTVNSYTLTFDSAGGSAVNAITADFGSSLTAPTNPTREGHTFTGWSPAVPSTMPAANTTLTAQWAVNTYTLTFDTAGGSAVNAVSADFGSVVTAPTAPTREGYTFAGWSPSVPETMPSSNITVTAQWTVNNYTLTFDAAGGSLVTPITAAFGSSVTAPTDPTREGYTFTGWSPAVPSTMPATDTTLTAQWTVNSYTLTFDSAGGSTVASITANFGAAVSEPAAPVREGYSFAGWSPALPTTMPATNTTLTAQWTINSYTLTFDTAGGSAVAPIAAAFGSSVTAPNAPTREGYTFAGWNPAVPSTMPATDTTLTAQWTVNSYTLTFDTAGGSPVASITTNFGSPITGPDAPTKDGYSFAGWNPILPATMPSANQTLIAQWSVNSYTITFDSAGGSVVEPITANFGSEITPPSAPTREGHTFSGWSQAVPTTMPSSNVTLTAQWTVNSYTITFDTAGGSAVAPITANFGSLVTPPAPPVRDNYTFTGWSPTVPASMPGSNVIVTAQWTPNNYTLTFDSTGGSAVSPITAAFGSVVAVPEPPTRPGYTFAGWSPAVPATMPGSDAIHTALWTVNSYTLTFDTAGGSAVSPITANFGDTVSAPAAPTRQGYSFAGWTPEIPSTMPSANITLVAQWVGNDFTLSFDSAGGTVVAPIVASAGSALVAPTAPTRQGYAFAGWEPAFPATMPTVDTLLVATWVANGYTLTFDSAGGSPVSPVTATAGSPITQPPAPVRDGYTFSGWIPAVPATMPATNTTVIAQWTANTYTLSFDSAGGSAVESITAVFGSAIRPPAAPTREGYTFLGWSPDVPSNMPAQNTTVVAQWKVNGYTLTFDSAGGSDVEPITASFGTAIAPPAEPTREGYSFAGWNPAVPATMPAENATITAQWTANSYTITFDPAGGSKVEPITALYGTELTPPSAPTRDGYVFTGWLPTMPARMPAEDITLTAQYESSGLTVTATVKGAATITPASQQVVFGSSAVFDLTLDNAGDVVVIAGSCQAALSGNRIVTAAVTENCDVAVTVYPTTTVVKDTEAALPSNGISRLVFLSGAGQKELVGAYVKRSGVETALVLEEAQELVNEQSDGSFIFGAERTGRYSLEFIDKVSSEQIVVTYDVMPHLAFTSARQPAKLDLAVKTTVLLSDEPIDYPVTATVIKEGINEQLQSIEISKDHGLSREYFVTANSQTARITLQGAGIQGAFLGSPAEHTLAIQSERPAAPLIAIATQNNVETYVIEKNAGTVVMDIIDKNSTEATYNWAASGLPLQISGKQAIFDPSTVAEGRFTVVITSQLANGQTGRYDLALRVVDSCPGGTCNGAGKTGIPAIHNQFAQMPNRLPLCPLTGEVARINRCNTEGSQELYIEVPSKYQPTLGVLSENESWSSGQFGATLRSMPINDDGYEQLGFIVNFDVLGLSAPGEVVQIVVPMPIGSAIPVNAVWRKFINGRWQNFVVDAANKIESAPRDTMNSCPGVSSDKWTSGVTQGHGCVRLSIQDGGPNDDDGVTNTVIRDPGVLSVPKAVVVPPEVTPQPNDEKKSGGSIAWLSVLFLSLAAGWRRRLLA